MLVTVVNLTGTAHALLYLKTHVSAQLEIKSWENEVNDLRYLGS